MKRFWTLVVPAAVAAALIAATSIVQGLWVERWGSRRSAELRVLAQSLEKIPMILGDWEGQQTDEFSDRPLTIAGALAHAVYSYHNPRTNQTVLVYLLCGASHSVEIHTPDACYPRSSFRMDGSPSKCTVEAGSSQAEFLTSVFLKEDETATRRLRLFWAWNAGGVWEAPNWPEVRYRGCRSLAKIYLIIDEPLEQSADGSPSLDFAQVFLPEVTRLLFPLASSGSSPVATPGDQAAPGAGAPAETSG